MTGINCVICEREERSKRENGGHLTSKSRSTYEPRLVEDDKFSSINAFDRLIGICAEFPVLITVDIDGCLRAMRTR